MGTLKEGDIITGTVTGVESYGIFVSIEKYNGLIHISEISHNFVKDVNEYAKVGQKIRAKIVEINESNRQLKLSIKDFEDSRRKTKRVKIVETPTGFNSLADNLEGCISIKISEINSKN